MVEKKKKKRKATVASTSTPTHKAKAPLVSTTTTPSTSSVAADASRPRVASRDVIVELPESQASASEIGVTDFMSQLDSTHNQGLHDLHFGNGDSYDDAYADEEEVEEVVDEEEEVE
jgi:hypothetical protein